MKNLISDLRKNKIYLELNNDELSIIFTEKQIPDFLLQKIKDNKESLVKYLQQRVVEKVDFTSIPKIPIQDSYRLSSSQFRLWIINQLEQNTVAYNMPSLYEFEGNLNIEAINLSFQELLFRHESLRTVFRQDEFGDVRQFVISKESLGFNISYIDLRLCDNVEEALNSLLEKEFSLVFDLEKGPLIRVYVYQLEDQKWLLGYTLHHIISDGWSTNVILRELLLFYNAHISGKDIHLEPLRIQYKDYSDWQQNQLKSDFGKRHKEYWLNQFQGEIPVLELPSDYSRPLIKTFNGGAIEKIINRKLSDQLNSFVQKQGGSLFMGLLAAVKVLLHRYTNQTDIVIGSPIAGREHIDLENQIGFYVNTMALRTAFEGSDSFEKLFTISKQICLDAYEHQSYPFDELVGALDLERDLSRNAIFDVMVVLQNAHINNEEDWSLPEGVRINPYQGIGHTTSKFDLSFIFHETDHEIRMVLEYNSDIYSGETADRMGNHLIQLLEAALKDTDLAINKLDYLTQQEKHQLLFEFNDTKVDYPIDKTIVKLFEEQVERTPDNIAVVFEDTELTYRELNEQANQLGDYLRRNYHIKPDDLVAIKLERSNKIIIAILGILKSGAAYVPIDPKYPQERIEYIEQDTNAKVTIDATFLEIYQEELKKEERQYTKQNLPIISRPDSLAYVIYTSGTTGKPKGVLVEHHSNINMSLDQIKTFGVTAEDKIVWFASVAFDASISEIMMSLYSGATLCIPREEEQKDKDQFISFLEKTKSTVVTFPPSYLKLLSKEDLKSLKTIITAGESANPIKAKEIVENGINYYNAYGPTEYSVCTSIFKLNSSHSYPSVPIGVPISNTRVYILDEDLRVVPIGVSGTLYISGAGLSRGYLNKPELTREKFIANPFEAGTKMYDTGDLARWLPDGNIEFLGRKDFQVKIRGYRIELGEIETHISQFSTTIEQVVAEAKEVNEEKVLVAYYTKDGEANIDKTELREYLQSILPEYMVPGFFVEMESISLTPNGKIDRKALPSVTGKDLIRREYVAPRNEIEQRLIKLIASILNYNESEISINDNFFDLGMSSLTLAQMKSLISAELKIIINISFLFEFPNVRESANKIYEIINGLEEESKDDEKELHQEIDDFLDQF